MIYIFYIFLPKDIYLRKIIYKLTTNYLYKIMVKIDKNNTVKIGLYLPEHISNALKRICTASGLTVNSLIKVVLFEFLTNNNYISSGELSEKKD